LNHSGQLSFINCNWSKVMLEQNTDDIDYENMDDLPLFDHIEWISYLTVKATLDQQNFLDWESV